MHHPRSFLFGMLVVPLAAVGLTVGFASDVTLPNTFAPNTPALAAEVNANFDAVENAVDDNASRISSLENAPKPVNQSVMTTARFDGLTSGQHTVAIFVRGDCNEVFANAGNFDQQVLIQEGNGTPSHLDYSGEDIDTTITANAELLRTIGNFNKATTSGTPLFVTWKGHVHVSGFDGTFADFQVRVDGNEGLPGSRVVVHVGRP